MTLPPPALPTTLKLIADLRHNAEEWGSTMNDAWRERLQASEDALLEHVARLAASPPSDGTTTPPPSEGFGYVVTFRTDGTTETVQSRYATLAEALEHYDRLAPSWTALELSRILIPDANAVEGGLAGQARRALDAASPGGGAPPTSDAPASQAFEEIMTYTGPDSLEPDYLHRLNHLAAIVRRALTPPPRDPSEGAGEPTPSEEARRLVKRLKGSLLYADEHPENPHNDAELEYVEDGIASFVASLESECAGLRAENARLNDAVAAIVAIVDPEGNYDDPVDAVQKGWDAFARDNAIAYGEAGAALDKAERCNSAEAVIDALAKEVGYVSPSPTNEEIRDCVLASFRAAPDTRDAEPTDGVTQ